MEDARMPIAQHLIELRSRLIICIVAVVLAMVVAYMFYPDVFLPILRAPLDTIQGEDSANPFVLRHPWLTGLKEYYQKSVREAADGEPAPGQAGPVRLKFTGLTSPIVVRLKVSLVIGMLLAIPVIFYELWAFISVGLRARERRLVFVYGPASLLLFMLGASVAYFVVLPLGTMVLLLSGVSQQMDPILTINEYAPLVMWLLFGFGVIFQMPLVTLFLTKLGIVNPDKLRKGRRYAILGIFILAAVFTPPDPFTQVAMALPMWGLYEFSILLSQFAVRKKAQA